MKELIENYQDAAVYCGTYAKYNDGSIEGKWLKFSDYSDAAEFFEACAELHDDEEDPEYMFQDCEYLPDSLYSESLSESDVESIYEYLELCEKLEDADWVSLWNEYQWNIGGEDHLHQLDEEFFNTYFQSHPMEAAMAAAFGQVNWRDSYISFNGYGNLVSTDDAESFIEFEELIDHILENTHKYSI